uniref:Uncharacterized protein n=1 Tax=Rhizophora mucronata TaxID=61149 RepID=A0A2P2PY36_RHIMU
MGMARGWICRSRTRSSTLSSWLLPRAGL